MRKAAGALIVFLLVLLYAGAQQPPTTTAAPSSSTISGFLNDKDEVAREAQFLAVPDPKLAREHLQTLTKAPHMAGLLKTKPPPITSRRNSKRRAWTPRLSSTRCC